MKISKWSVNAPIEDVVKDVSVLNGNLDGCNYVLRLAEIKIKQEQIRLASNANELNEKLLLSNERASTNNDKNAILMNNATQQLAKSTNLLNLATWALVAFTAVQALIALAAFFKE
jgi:hypothetical protein